MSIFDNIALEEAYAPHYDDGEDQSGAQSDASMGADNPGDVGGIGGFGADGTGGNGGGLGWSVTLDPTDDPDYGLSPFDGSITTGGELDFLSVDNILAQAELTYRDYVGLSPSMPSTVGELNEGIFGLGAGYDYHSLSSALDGSVSVLGDMSSYSDFFTQDFSTFGPQSPREMRAQAKLDYLQMQNPFSPLEQMLRPDAAQRAQAAFGYDMSGWATPYTADYANAINWGWDQAYTSFQIGATALGNFALNTIEVVAPIAALAYGGTLGFMAAKTLTNTLAGHYKYDEPWDQALITGGLQAGLELGFMGLVSRMPALAEGIGQLSDWTGLNKAFGSSLDFMDVGFNVGQYDVNFLDASRIAAKTATNVAGEYGYTNPFGGMNLNPFGTNNSFANFSDWAYDTHTNQNVGFDTRSMSFNMDDPSTFTSGDTNIGAFDNEEGIFGSGGTYGGGYDSETGITGLNDQNIYTGIHYLGGSNMATIEQLNEQMAQTRVNMANAEFQFYNDAFKPYQQEMLQSQTELLPYIQQVQQAEAQYLAGVYPEQGELIKNQMIAAQNLLPGQQALAQGQLDTATAMLPAQREAMEGILSQQNTLRPEQTSAQLAQLGLTQAEIQQAIGQVQARGDLTSSQIAARQSDLTQSQPVATEYFNKALQGNQQVNVQDRIASAQGNVAAQFDLARNASNRDLARQGIQAGSGQAVNAQTDLRRDEALARAQAGTAAMRNAEIENRDINTSNFNMMGSALATRNNAMGSFGANTIGGAGAISSGAGAQQVAAPTQQQISPQQVQTSGLNYQNTGYNPMSSAQGIMGKLGTMQDPAGTSGGGSGGGSTGDYLLSQVAQGIGSGLGSGISGGVSNVLTGKTWTGQSGGYF